MSRIKISIDTSNCIFPLTLVRYWNSGDEKDGWKKHPPQKLIEPGTVTTLEFDGHDRAGCVYKTQLANLRECEVKMAFTCPRSSGNSAEGNAAAGLQAYEESGTPVTFKYAVFQGAKADWGDGSSHDDPSTPDEMKLPSEPIYHP